MRNGSGETRCGFGFVWMGVVDGWVGLCRWMDGGRMGVIPARVFLCGGRVDVLACFVCIYVWMCCACFVYTSGKAIGGRTDQGFGEGAALGEGLGVGAGPLRRGLHPAQGQLAEEDCSVWWDGVWSGVGCHLVAREVGEEAAAHRP